VVVGGVLSGGIAWSLARRTDTRQVRASARLVQEELFRIHLETLNGIKYRNGVVSYAKFTLAAWEEHQKTLAQGLSDEAWIKLGNAYRQVETRQAYERNVGDRRFKATETVTRATIEKNELQAARGIYDSVVTALKALTVLSGAVPRLPDKTPTPLPDFSSLLRSPRLRSPRPRRRKT
jgi:hypothetical protein